MPRAKEDDASDEDLMRILIATDCHVGYMEKDAVRGKDSINTFEEILQLAQKKEVDFILLGGDLFHDNKPSRNTIHGVMALLRKYCLGDKACAVEMRSDQSIDFGHTQFPTVNYEDPNLNVGIPVFSIHGNHDDPTGQGNLCSLDLLSVAGLVNYFGKYTNLDKIEISPLLLQKGDTKLALYGLGSIRDERLHRMFVHKHVQMLRPTETPDDWFNLFVIHQNRAKHGPTNYIPEQFLDDFLDLIFWGHEHECKVEPHWNGIQNFYITQPGSSIATSLSEGETRKKHVGLLNIRKKDFKVSKLPLNTVRQFYMKDLVLGDTSIDPEDPDCAKRVSEYCAEKVEMLLETAEEERYANPKLPEKPLIRLRVDYSGGFDCFNTHRFGQKYVDKVANPKDMILFTKKKQIANRDDKKDIKLDESALADLRPENLDSCRVEDMVKEYFTQVEESQQMVLLTERGMGEAVKEFVDKEERDAINELVKHQLNKTQKHLVEKKSHEDTIDHDVSRFKQERTGGKEEDEEVQEAIKKSRENTRKNPEASRADSDDDFGGGLDSNDDEANDAPARGRGRGRGRGSRGGRGRGESTRARGRGRGRGRGSKTPVVENVSIQDAFKRGSQKSSRGGASKMRDDSEDEVTMIDDDSDEFDPRPTPKRKQNGTQNKRKAKQQDSDDDDDSWLMEPKKRRR